MVRVLRDDLAYQRIGIVNVILYGLFGAADREWVLIDAGLPGTEVLIRQAAARRFEQGARPAAIILTHGHFDHVGALRELAQEWDAPIFAHPLEMPFLQGNASYPPPDTSVGGGVMSSVAALFPKGPIDVSAWLCALPSDGSVPGMPQWQWLPTPGHTPGHISLWRAADRTLIAGDAFCTTKQESAFAVLTQRAEVHGPPMYFTQDWQQARTAVSLLAHLQPDVAICGHGPAMYGDVLCTGLHMLSEHFVATALPRQGKYVQTPAPLYDELA